MPPELVGSLVARIEGGFSDLHEPNADERIHPATRLARALSRVSENELHPRGDRRVVLIDGLDEYGPLAGGWMPANLFWPQNSKRANL